MLKKSKELVMTTIILILLLQCSAILGVSADVSFHPSHAYVHLSANPIGVGQTLEVLFRVEEANPLSSGFANPIVWEGFTVKITLPDGIVENKTNLKADATGGSWFLYTPTQVGNYTFQTIFPGQWVNGSFRTVGLNGGSWSNASTLPLKTLSGSTNQVKVHL